jgi:hypothetical protein
MPIIEAITSLIIGEIRLLSIEYLTKKPAPTNKARPPSHAKSWVPVKRSQSISEKKLDQLN